MEEKIKKIAKIILLIGVFLPIFSLFFVSDPYIHGYGIKPNLDRMKVTIYKGKPVPYKFCLGLPNRFNPNIIENETCSDRIKYEGGIEIPLIYPLVSSVALIFTGILLLIF